MSCWAQGSHHGVGSGFKTGGVQWQPVKPGGRSVNHGSPAPSCLPEAARGPGRRPPRGVRKRGPGRPAIARPGGVAHRTGTCTGAALPKALSAEARSEPRHGGARDHSAPGGYVACPPHSDQALPPPAGGPTCAGRPLGGRGAAAPATEPGRWLERRPAPALRGAAPSAGLRRPELSRWAQKARARGPETPSLSPRGVRVRMRGCGLRVKAAGTGLRVSYSNSNSVEEVSLQERNMPSLLP